MKRLLLTFFICTLCVQLNAQPTKTVSAVDEWQEVAQNATLLGAIIDVSALYDVQLHIDMALSTATAHTGTIIEVWVSSETSGDEGWSVLGTPWLGPTGTAVSLTPSGTEAAAQTVIETDATSGDYESDGSRWVFFEDVVTVADSELMRLISHVANTSITVAYGIANAKGTDDRVYSKATRYIIPIPLSANRVRVFYDNTFDSNGSTVHIHTRRSNTTAF